MEEKILQLLKETGTDPVFTPVLISLVNLLQVKPVTSNFIRYLVQNITEIISVINLHGETDEAVSIILTDYEAHKMEE